MMDDRTLRLLGKTLQGEIVAAQLRVVQRDQEVNAASLAYEDARAELAKLEAMASIADSLRDLRSPDRGDRGTETVNDAALHNALADDVESL